jgi:hypothetical protein
MGADEDSDQEVGDDITSHPEASSAAKPTHRTRAAIAKQLKSKAEARVKEANSRLRIRRGSRIPP